jgi:hypothetical protein
MPYWASAIVAIYALGCSAEDRNFVRTSSATPDSTTMGESPATSSLDPSGAEQPSKPTNSPGQDGEGSARTNQDLQLEPSPNAQGGGVPESDTDDTEGSEPAFGPLLTAERDQLDLGSAEVGTTGDSFTWTVTNSGQVSTGPLVLAQAGPDFLVSNGCTAALDVGSRAALR